MTDLTKYQEGNRCLVTRQYEEAVRLFRSHAETHPEDVADCHERMAECYCRCNSLAAPAPIADGVQLVSQGNHRSAEYHYRQALVHDPSHFAALYRLAMLLPAKSQERFDLLCRATSIREDTMALNELGDVYRSVRKDLPAAYGCYRRAVDHTPKDKTAYTKLQDVCRRMERLDEAKEWAARWRDADATRRSR